MVTPSMTTDTFSSNCSPSNTRMSRNSVRVAVVRNSRWYIGVTLESARDPYRRMADDDRHLRFWEPHDLAFHRRSRGGFNSGPLGATVRFAGSIDPMPAVKPP